MRLVGLFCLFAYSFWGQSNIDTALVQKEKQLFKYLNELRAAQTDEEKQEKNSIFKNELKQVLQQKSAFSYPFSSIKTVGFIDSPDGQLRIVNWNVELSDQSQVYNCFILHYNNKKKMVEFTELVDNSLNMELQPQGILDSENWYGALYYKIIPIEKSGKKIYTLLGWDGNNSMSSIKLLDALYFNGSQVKFGSPIFKTNEALLKRVFYEHSKKTTMSLNYDQSLNRIVMDHLSPESPNLKGFYSFYVPDLSYDAFVLIKDKWVLKEDVIAVNKGEEEKGEIYVKNERNNKIEKKKIDNKWENPQDVNAPGGANIHIASLPENTNQKETTNNNSTLPKVNKKDNRDPSNMSATYGNKKRKKTKK